MRDYSEEQIYDGRPKIEPKRAINFCLDQLVADKKKEMTDEVARRLTYEELLGALLLAKDEMERLENEVNNQEYQLDKLEDKLDKLSD